MKKKARESERVGGCLLALALTHKFIFLPTFGTRGIQQYASVISCSVENSFNSTPQRIKCRCHCTTQVEHFRNHLIPLSGVTGARA